MSLRDPSSMGTHCELVTGTNGRYVEPMLEEALKPVLWRPVRIVYLNFR